MDLKELKYKANYYSLLLLSFVIPLERRLAPPLIGAFVLTSLINRRKDLGSKEKRILGFTSLFFVYVIGLVYSSNLHHGIEEVVKSLSLLVFPVALFFSNINYKNKLNAILNSFIDGCFVSGILSLISSFIHYYFTLDSSMFFYGNFSVYLHASYLSMYANFSILSIYYLIFNPNKPKSISPLRIFMLLFFTSIVVFAASKTGLISLIVIHFGAILYWIYQEKKWFIGISAFLLFIVFLTTAYFESAKLKSRVDEMIQVATTHDTSDRSTTAARVEIWKIAVNLIKEEPWLGYGTGDASQQLVNEYQHKGFLDLYEKKLNAHNQFLQTTLQTGLVGGIILLISFVIPTRIALKKREFLYLFFLILFVFNLMTEAMLERQSGVVFYALFNALFFRIATEKTADDSSLQN